jgi:hypothetical protein
MAASVTGGHHQSGQDGPPTNAPTPGDFNRPHLTNSATMLYANTVYSRNAH